MVVESPQPQAQARSLNWMLAVALLHFFLLLVSLQLSGSRSTVAVFWFAGPVGTVGLLASERAQWPRLLLFLGAGSALAHTLHGDFGAATGLDWNSLWLVAVSLLEMPMAACLLRRCHCHADDLYSPQRLARLLAFGAALPVLATSLLASVVNRGNGWHWESDQFVGWLVGHLIGAVGTLPLALVYWLRGPGALRRGLVRRPALPLLLLSMGVTLAGATSLPHPFVVMIIPMVMLAFNAGFAVTALAGFATALLVAGLLGAGVLLAPPSAVWWGDVLYYGAILAALIPGLFLASSVEGRAVVLHQIRANEERYRKLYIDTPAMMHSADASSSLGGPILSVSERWLQVTGYRRDEVEGHRFAEFLTPESRRFASEVAIPQLLAQRHCEDFEGQMIARDGRVLDVLFSAVLESDENGRPLRTYAVIQDITEKKHLAARSHFAEHDQLTGLPNRVLLNDRLERTCAHHERYGGAFAVGFLDLDHFKDVNDRYGHDAGDYLLQQVALRLQEALRATDTVCRLGGDEFVVLYSQAEDAQALSALARKVLQQVAQPLVLECEATRPQVTISASMGLAIYPQHGRDPQTLLQRADEAMYHSKRGGRNRCEVYTVPGEL